MSDELKNLWQQYDQQIERSTRPNDVEIRQLLANRTRQNLHGLYRYELMAAAILVLSLLLLVPSLWLLSQDWRFAISINIALFITILDIVFQFYKFNLYKQLQRLDTPVAEYATLLRRLQTWIVREQLTTVIILPIYVMLVVPVVRWWLYEEVIFDDIAFYKMLSIAAIVLGSLLGWFFYKYFYINVLKTLRTAWKGLDESAH